MQSAILPEPTFAFHVFAPRKHEYCVIVGVLNNGDAFRAQLARMQPYSEVADIIVVDGGSTDGATSLDFVAGKVSAIFIRTSGGGGLSSQYSKAFRFAMDEGYAGVVVMDGNGKDGVESIPRFVQALESGYDMVQGSRFLPGGEHKNTPLDRIIANRFIFSPLMHLASGYPYTDAINGFKAHSRRYLLDPRLQPFRYVFPCYGLQFYLTCRARKLGYKITELPVSRGYPDAGPTPTKINGLRGRLGILWELFNTIIGRYNPA